jgi:chromosome segregation ATPase
VTRAIGDIALFLQGTRARRRPLNVRALIVMLLIALIAAAGIYRLGRSARQRSAVETLGDSVQSLRAATDTCNADLRRAEVALGEYRDRLDSLHSEVRGFEAEEPGTVPAELFDEYMEAFDRYSDSTAAWAGRVDSLEIKLAECRSLAEAHNTALDSLRAILPKR